MEAQHEAADPAPLVQHAAFGTVQSIRRAQRMVGMLSAQKWRTYAAGPDEIEEGRVRESPLLKAAQSGDHLALERLLAPYERPLYTLCRGILGHADDAEDAVQETFLRALRALPRFRGDAAIRSWLYRIAVNVCLDRKRAQEFTEPWDEEQCPIASPTASPESMALRRLRVMEALETLLPRHRALLLLKELEGWNVTEIARALGWNEKRVYNELYKARRALADWRRRDAGEGDEP